MLNFYFHTNSQSNLHKWFIAANKMPSSPFVFTILGDSASAFALATSTSAATASQASKFVPWPKTGDHLQDKFAPVPAPHYCVCLSEWVFVSVWSPRRTTRELTEHSRLEIQDPGLGIGDETQPHARKILYPILRFVTQKVKLTISTLDMNTSRPESTLRKYLN